MAITDRSRELTTRVTKNIFTMFIIKGISILISFLYVPLLYNTLNNQHYGIWLSLTSIVSWISMFDIGLGHGLRNKLSEALANDDVHRGKKYVSTAYVCITVLSLTIILLFLGVNRIVSWEKVLNAESADISGLNTLVVIVIISFCINFMLSIINSVLYALQRPSYSSLISTAGQLLSYLTVLILVKVYNITSLLILGSAISIIPVIVVFGFTISIFNKKYSAISPSLTFFDSSKIRDILGLGGQFFIIQLSTLCIYQTNNLIIAHTVDNAAVVEYNIAYKYMNILVMLFNIIATPIWSATTDAYTRRDFDWIKNTNKKLLKIVLLIGVVGFIMLTLSPISYKLWIGESSVTSTTTILLYLYAVLMMIYGSYGYILNGIGKLRIQLVATAIIAIVYIPLSVFAGKFFGLSGILIVFILSTMVNCIWSKIQYTKIINNTATGIWSK